jgi:SAM-dependent methyltransferase
MGGMNCSVRTWIKQLVAQSPWLKAILYVIDDLWWGVRLHFGQIETGSGTTHATISIKDSLHYIEEVFRDYKHYGELASFRGVVAEVGPGDNAGVALLMRKDGCDQVDLIDRYFSRRDSQKQGAIYDALSKKHQLARLKGGSTWNDAHLMGITQSAGRSAEEFFRDCAQCRGSVYDVIVSRSVLEHLYDPLNALESMVSCLKPGGKMIHKIDLRDHGMFTPEHHELTFLRLQDGFYRFMTQNSGRPNRVLFHRYRERLEWLQEAKRINYVALITRLAGVGDLIPHQLPEKIDADTWRKSEKFVEEYRPRVAQELSQVASRDLAVTGIFLVATRTCQ